MKYPILTKLLSVALCLCCLAMLISGIYGIKKAGADRELELSALSGIQKKAEDYKSLDQALKGEISYAEAKKELESRQESHREASSEHKKELTEYSAVKGGLSIGRNAVTEAEIAMKETKAYYEQGMAELKVWEAALAEMQNTLPEARAQYEAGLELYNFAVNTADGIKHLLNELYSLDEIMDNDDSEARFELSIEAYNRAISAFESTMNLVWELEDQGIVSSEQILAAEDQLIAATGMSSSDILNLLYNARDEIAAGAKGGISEEEFIVIKEIYNQNRDFLMSAAASVETILIETDWQLGIKGEELNAAGEQLKQGEEMLAAGLEAMPQARAALEEMGNAMEQGGDALIQAENGLNAKLGELDEQFEELKDEKECLSSEAKKIRELEAETKERKELEAKRTSLSVGLRKTEEIKAMYEDGTEVYEAAGKYAEDKKLSIEHNYDSSIYACTAMTASAVLGILSLFGIFGKRSSRRVIRLTLPAICFVFSVTAELIAYINGLGNVYSSLTVSVIAAMTLIAAIPDRKKKITGII